MSINTKDKPNQTIVQLHDNSHAGIAAANEFVRHAKIENLVTIETVNVDELFKESDSQQAAVEQLCDCLQNASFALAWMEVGKLESLLSASTSTPIETTVLFSGLMNGSSSTNRRLLKNIEWVTAPTASQVMSGGSPDLFRVRRWLSSRKIYNMKHERLQLNTYFTCFLVKHAFRHMVLDFDRDHFIEWAEHECESTLNPGMFKKLSLGPGQRFASRLESATSIQPRNILLKKKGSIR